MIIRKLQLTGFRNLADLTLCPCEGVNVIYGENAQGKTNLLESIWLFSGMKSFRGAKDSELVGFGKPFARMEMDFFSAQREQKAVLTVENSRKATLNGVSLSSAAKLMGKCHAAVFSPAFLSLVQAGPSERRRFLDMALCQIKPSYAQALRIYNRALKQRNALLGDLYAHPELEALLEVWDARLCEAGEEILQAREEYLTFLQPTAEQVYDGLSSSREKLNLVYIKKDNAQAEKSLAQLLNEHRREDIINKTTSVGPHRDDMGIFINGAAARTYGSQGQQRSCAIALKLSEAQILKEITGEQPVILLDDVMSELDAGRQDYILNHIGDRQVFITCCDPASILRLCNGKTFEIANGKII
ncbi:MAG: DNA replication/repair protein RecF [Clostridia bacterium]|nr:DNA replication/repair protein RecF [Clostridia bacterium]